MIFMTNLSVQKFLFVPGHNPVPGVGVGNALRRFLVQAGNFLLWQGDAVLQQLLQIALVLAPVQGRVFTDFLIKANVEQEVQLGASQGLQERRVGAADRVAVEVAKGVLADVLEQILIVNRPDELHPRILVKVGLRLQLVVELVVLDVGNQHQVLLDRALHELADHRSEIVFGHKAANHQEIFVLLDAEPLVPVADLPFVRHQRGGGYVCPVGDEGRLRLVLGVVVLDVLLDRLAVTNQLVGVLNHQPFRVLPVGAYRLGPLGPLPLVAIGVYPHLEAVAMKLWQVGMDEGPHPAGEDVDDPVA